MNKNKNLHKAKNAKNDEFYTRLEDVSAEAWYYKDHFKDKVIYCNCDDYETSKFFHYFSYQFEFLGLKKLIATAYNEGGHGVCAVYEGDKDGNLVPDAGEITVTQLKGDGDFRSDECVELLKEADIVVTNVPFSLFREYVAQLEEHEKDYLIIGNMNAITYKEIFPLLKDNKLWLGRTGFNAGMYFHVPDDFVYAKTYKFEREQKGEKVSRVPGICWFTNLDHTKRHEDLVLYKRYTSEEYPTYDNYDAIEVSRVANIPEDYAGVMGVPITFLDKHNPAQFEIIGCSYSYGDPVGYHTEGRSYDVSIQGVSVYKRLFIKNKKVTQ